MTPQQAKAREAGQRWVIETLRQDERVHALKVASEWGPHWDHLPPGAPRRREATMLILTHGRSRKVAWLKNADLKAAADGGPDQVGARRRLRERVGVMVDELASRSQTDGDA